MPRAVRVSPAAALLCAWVAASAAVATPGTGSASPPSAPAAAPDATDLVRRADQHMRGDTEYAEMTMKVIRPDWSRETSMKAWTKGRDDALILITAPPRDRGTAFLKRGTEMWNWLPSVERVIKISPSMMLQPWMGSDFTNDDLVRESSVVDDYEHAVAGEDTVDGRECWKVDLTPKPDAPVVWGKVVMWIEKAAPIEVRVEYFDEGGTLVNVETLSDVRTMGGRDIPTVLTMTPVGKSGHSTVLTVESCTFNAPIEDSFFSEQSMKRLH
jgi:outer membrane lipoprotein-sorting protein